MFWHAFEPFALAVANSAVLVTDPPWRASVVDWQNADVQVLVFASRRTGQSAVFFVIFVVCWLTLARGQRPRFTLRPEGGSVVDGLGNFHSFCHFESCSCQVSFLWSSFCVFDQGNTFLDFGVLCQYRSSLWSKSAHVKHYNPMKHFSSMAFSNDSSRTFALITSQ